jgi:class 3 adenylate cyclase/CheY-like chemotaxis protein
LSEPAANILVVDDIEDNRFTLERRLRRLGYNNIRSAANGREAIDIVESEPVDLMLLDIMMPDVDGYQVLEHMKRDMNLRHIPVIMISAIDEMDSVIRCIEMGAEDYLTKPFNPTLLKARIGASLEKKQLRDLEVSYREQIRSEKRRVDELLNSILPAEAVRELKSSGGVTPRRYENVAILFCDIVGFTAYCDQHMPETVVGHLQNLVEEFERVVREHGMEKIKTIGDAFMATSSMLIPIDAPLLTAVRCGLEMALIASRTEPNWDVRIGVHFGPVVGGIVGKQQFLFDVWGDTVNVAARLTEHGIPGTVALTHDAWREIQDECRARSLGHFDIKGKGAIEIVECYALIG